MSTAPTTVSATEFKAKCLALIDDMNRTKVLITITKHGKLVAEIFPARDEHASVKPFIGLLKGSVLRYDAPFGSALEPAEWDAVA